MMQTPRCDDIKPSKMQPSTWRRLFLRPLKLQRHSCALAAKKRPKWQWEFEAVEGRLLNFAATQPPTLQLRLCSRKAPRRGMWRWLRARSRALKLKALLVTILFATREGVQTNIFWRSKTTKSVTGKRPSTHFTTSRRAVNSKLIFTVLLYHLYTGPVQNDMLIYNEKKVEYLFKIIWLVWQIFAQMSIFG